jgi:large subunit ribosomal protein L22
MEVESTLKYARFSQLKGRLAADLIRGMSVEEAFNVLTFNRKRAAVYVKKALQSAVANAEHNFGADVSELFVSKIHVNQGPSMKRVCPRARGRANRIIKRFCHITIFVSDKREGKK